MQDALQEAFQDLDTLLTVATPEEMREEETEKVLVETLDPEL